MGLEIERKYLQVNLQTLRQTLVDNGAHCLGAHFECNWVFDTSAGGLVTGGQLLRLRSQLWQDKTRYLLTLKLPVLQSGGFKMREERETEVADGAAMGGVMLPRAVFQAELARALAPQTQTGAAQHCATPEMAGSGLPFPWLPWGLVYSYYPAEGFWAARS